MATEFKWRDLISFSENGTVPVFNLSFGVNQGALVSGLVDDVVSDNEPVLCCGVGSVYGVYHHIGGGILR